MIPQHRGDREYQKFVEDDEGNVAVRTTAKLETGDIEIGAVEIKDHDSDDRVEVNSNNRLTAIDMGKLVPKEYDYISLSYTDDDLTGVVYKTGGSGGTTVATLTLTYTDNVLQSVERS